MSPPKVHNVRFYRPKPYAINSMVLNESKNLLAVGRLDGSIEIWNLNSSPFIEKRIPSIVDNNSVEQLCWYGKRLFSVSLSGFLIEYDLLDLTIKHRSAVTGEVAFCLDASSDQSQLAVGTEQGYLNIFSVNEEVLFEKFLDKQEGRILCLKYFAKGLYIASGGIDAIRVWNVKSGQAIHRITTGRAEANKETIVWDLQVTWDGTIISGDSRGRITFWDSKIGAQIESFQSHRADVLSVCLSSNEKTLYCAGVDPIIISYEKVNVKGTTQKWVKSIQRKVHDHDVKCLVLCEEKLYSSGVDGYLACSYHPPKTLHKFPPILPSSCVCLSKDENFVLLQYSSEIELWQLGSASKINENEHLFKLDSSPKKLLQLFRSIKDSDGNEQKEGIICSAISNDGKWIMFSTNTATRIFNFVNDKKKPSLIPLNDISKEYPVCLKVTFSKDNKYLILACRSSILKIVNLKSDFSCQTLNLAEGLEDSVAFLEISCCNNYITVADSQSNIFVFKKNAASKWEHYCKLPKYQTPPTALSFSPHKPLLLVVYADQKIIEYNLKSRKISTFSNILDSTVANKFLNKWSAVKNILFDPIVAEIIVFYDDSSIIVVRKKTASSEPDNKIRKLENDVKENKEQKRHVTVHVIKKYKHLMFLDWISQDEMVAVEVKPLSLTEQLPPCLKQNLFGTK